MPRAWAYYNEFDEGAAEWLRNLIKAGEIAPGEVDTRSIVDVRPEDLNGFAQRHFFAGIGVWSRALREAGFPDDRECFTGSCPCQPWSAAGKREGGSDERHLWPVWHGLIDAARPPVIFFEQVASAAVIGKRSVVKKTGGAVKAEDGPAWLDIVAADLEASQYALGTVSFPAGAVGAPHLRMRLYGVAEYRGTRRMEHAPSYGRFEGRTEPGGRILTERCLGGELADDGRERWDGRGSDSTVHESPTEQRASGLRVVGGLEAGPLSPRAWLRARYLGHPARHGSGPLDRVTGASVRSVEPDRGSSVPCNVAGSSERLGSPSRSGLEERNDVRQDSGPECQTTERTSGDAGELVYTEGGGACSAQQSGPLRGAVSTGYDEGQLAHLDRAGQPIGEVPVQPRGSRQTDLDAVGDGGSCGMADAECAVRGPEPEGRNNVSHGHDSGRDRASGGPELDSAVDPLDSGGRPGPTNGFWGRADWIFCRDGRWRPTQPSKKPMAHGTPGSLGPGGSGETSEGGETEVLFSPLIEGKVFRVDSGHAYAGKSRVGMLKGYGNAIVLPAATAFIESYLEASAEPRP